MLPLVSCIMPTYNRRAFVPQAVAYFLRQSYPHKELVIVDDGPQPVSDLLPAAALADGLLRYLRLEKRQSTGAKRNLACREARGDLIMHWDDDDWMSPERIRIQVAALQQANAQVCGLRQMLFYDPAAGLAWLYSYPPKGRPWLAGGSLLYTRDFWRSGPFPNIREGEDTRFVWAHNLKGAAVPPDHRFYVALVHPGNTSAKRTRQHYWQPVDVGEARLLLGADDDFYCRLFLAPRPVTAAKAAPAERVPAAQAAAPAAPERQLPPASVSAGAPQKDLLPANTPNDASAVHLLPASASAGAPAVHLLPANASTGAATTGEQTHLAASPVPALDRVTVSIPCYNVPATLRQAVESILAQTYPALTLVVVNDGGDPPWRAIEDIHDPRLVRFDLPLNRGRYFADAVVLEATSDPYFLVQDADDWSEPQRLATLLRALRRLHAQAAFSAQWRYDELRGRKGRVLERYPGLLQPLTPRFEHRANHHGLYQTAALRLIGGFYAGFRYGYDTLLVNLLLMTARLALSDEPLYHRRIRPGSLTTAQASGFQSPARRQAAQALHDIYRTIFPLYNRYLEGLLEAEALAAHIRQVIAGRTPAGEQAALQTEAARLRLALQTVPPALPGAQARPTPAVSIREAGPGSGLDARLQAILKDPRLPWPAWSTGPAFARLLAARLERIRPERILEAGSGSTSVLLAGYAAHSGAHFTCLEHDPAYYQRTARLLEQFGLSQFADLRLAPLEPLPCPDGRLYPWYQADLQGPFDFALLDGPPERFGRQAALFALAPLLAPSWEAWLHDGERPHEQACMALWQAHLSFASRRVAHAGGEFYFLSSLERSPGRSLDLPQTGLPGVGISLLTGGRLDLLRRTLRSLQAHAARLLEKAYIVAMVNGRDPQSRAYLESLPYIDRLLLHSRGVLPIGEATSQLVEHLASQPSVEYILHLEDDWVASADQAEWLPRAVEILASFPHVGQVRARHSQERVLSYNMITRQPIRWTRQAGFLLSDAAHFTFNPSLIRSTDAQKLYPCRSETEAQRKFLEAGWATAQLLPGVFRHIGENRSRRLALRK